MHAVEAVDGALPRPGEAAARVEGQVLRHLRVRRQPQLAEPEPPRPLLGVVQQRDADARALTPGVDRDRLDVEVVGLRDEHDEAGRVAVVGHGEGHLPCGDAGGVVVVHRSGTPSDALDVYPERTGHEVHDRRDVVRLGDTQRHRPSIAGKRAHRP